MTQDSTTKVCVSCKQEKLKYVDFAMVQKSNRPNPYVRSECRVCRSKNEMERRNKKRDVFLARQSKWREQNKDKIKQYHLDKRDENLQRFKEYREKNKDILKQKQHEYNQDPINKSKRNVRDRKRKQIDVPYRMACNIRTRIHNVLKQNKHTKTDELLGCNREQLVQWITYQLNQDLSWDNYGNKWQIDHVIPLAFFDLEDICQQTIAFNWANLRPLPVLENLQKNDSIKENDIQNHRVVFNNFIHINSGYPTSTITCWVQRMNNFDGKNSQVDGNFMSYLKWIISSECVIDNTTFND